MFRQPLPHLGLKSAAGHKLNGQIGTVKGIAVDTGRLQLRLDESDSPHQWMLIKPANLREEYGDLDLELRHWEAILHAEPDNVQALLRAARACHGLALSTDKKKYCERGLKLRPQEHAFLALMETSVPQYYDPRDVSSVMQQTALAGCPCTREDAIEALKAIPDWIVAVMRLTSPRA